MNKKGQEGAGKLIADSAEQARAKFERVKNKRIIEIVLVHWNDFEF